MSSSQKTVETQVDSKHECMHCKKLVGKCNSCGKPMKRGYWIECQGDIHRHVRCPVGAEPDVWD